MKRFKGIYWRQFGINVGLVSLTLILLGTSFFSLTYSYMMTAKRNELVDKANIIARLAENAYATFSVIERDENLREIVNVAQQMSDINFLIWMPDLGGFVGTDSSVAGARVSLPDAMGERLKAGETYAGSTDLGIYEKPRFVVAVPAHERGGTALVGPVLAVAEPMAITEMWRAFLGIFGLTAVTVLLIAFVATASTTMQQVKPIKDIASAAKHFAEGNFDARVQDTNRDDEIGELTQAFNDMADTLQRTEMQRREFIANISHELKTPMTSIAGYAEGILDGVISPDQERHYLTIIAGESRRLAQLVRRMLDVSQLQSLEPQKRPFDLCESMRRVLVSMEQRITNRGLDVEVDIPENPVMVLGDNDLLTQVVYNLLENAAKFATPGSTLFLGLSRRGPKVVVTVRNEGETIPPEELPRLFERFHKSDPSRSADKDGVGLGLYIVRTILELHREKITVTSENGVTIFSFTVQPVEG